MAMPPTIVLIRHAQGLHNVNKEYHIHDPPLTDIGIEQCVSLRKQLQKDFSQLASDPNDVAIIVSPMRRTLQTAMLSLDWLMERGVKAEGNADWQENSDKPCDTGSPVSTLTPDFPTINLSVVDPVWPDKTSPSARNYAYSKQAILARGQRCLQSLRDRPEKLIFVVAHSGFLRLGVVGFWFFNADYRTFEFEDGLKLRQHEGTLEGGMGLSWRDPVELGSELPEEDPEVDGNDA